MALTTYLPRYSVDMVAAHPVPGIVSGKFPNGTVLFADVSGSTAMSEKLSVLGKEGAQAKKYGNAVICKLGRYRTGFKTAIFCPR